MKTFLLRLYQGILCAAALWLGAEPTQAAVQMPIDEVELSQSITNSTSSVVRPGIEANRMGGPALAGSGPGRSGSVVTTAGPANNVAASTAAADQSYPAGISDGAGGMILVWEDERGSTVTGWDIYAQRVLACGALDPGWPAGGVPITRAPNNDVFPVICSDGAGGAFVVWFSSFFAGGDIFAQHLLANGTIDAAWPANGLGVCTAPRTQRLPKLTTDGAGGAFVTWDDTRDGLPGTRRVFAQHLLASGVDPAWAVDGIPVCPIRPATDLQGLPVICSDGAGGAIVAWVDARNGIPNRDIFAQRMSSSGALLWAPAGEPVCTAPGVQLLNGAGASSFWPLTSSDEQTNAIVPDDAGGCVITWLDARNLSLAPLNHDIYAQRLTASGGVAAGWPANGVPLCTDLGNQNAPGLVPDGSGGAIATWYDSRPAPFAQHVSGAGILTGPANGLALSGAGPALFAPLGVSDGSGGAIFVWSDPRNYATSGDDQFAHHVKTTPALAIDPAWPIDGTPVSTAPGDQGSLEFDGSGRVVADGAGGAVAAWSDTRNSTTSGIDVYTQSLLASGSLPEDPVASITGPASGSVFPINTAVTFTGSFTDTDPDLHTAEWEFDALPPVAAIVNEVAHTVSVNYTFTTPGVYLVKVTVTDQCGGTSTSTQVDGFDAMVVIYDPNAGFVTGGGWINSPAGAYVPDPSLVGKANFGFVAKYHRGATVPTGNTEFQFRAANLNFSSTSYDWLVVAGAKAQYKGVGTINGAGDYRFMLTAIDGNLQGSQPDRFRMKITDPSDNTLVYDNQLNAPDGSDPTTLLGGGSIVIHKPNGVGLSDGSELRDADFGSATIEYALSRGEPNPFKLDTVIHYGLPELSRVEIDLYDVSGRRVRSLVHGELPAGAHELRLSNQDRSGNPLTAGLYFLRMSANSLQTGAGFSATRKLVVTP